MLNQGQGRGRVDSTQQQLPQTRHQHKPYNVIAKAATAAAPATTYQRLKGNIFKNEPCLGIAVYRGAIWEALYRPRPRALYIAGRARDALRSIVSLLLPPFTLYLQAPWPNGAKAWWWDWSVYHGSHWVQSTASVDLRDHDSFFWTLQPNSHDVMRIVVRLGVVAPPLSASEHAIVFNDVRFSMVIAVGIGGQRRTRPRSG